MGVGYLPIVLRAWVRNNLNFNFFQRLSKEVLLGQIPIHYSFSEGYEFRTAEQIPEICSGTRNHAAGKMSGRVHDFVTYFSSV